MPVPRYAAFPASAAFQGSVEQAALYAGQSCELVNDVRPAGDLVTEIGRQAEQALAATTVKP